jgi:hypothetical protein
MNRLWALQTVMLSSGAEVCSLKDYAIAGYTMGASLWIKGPRRG